MKLLKKIIGFEFLLMLALNSYTFYNLIQLVDHINTDKEWKFYCALIGFAYCFFLLFLLTIAPIIVQLALKQKNKLEAFYDSKEEYKESL